MNYVENDKYLFLIQEFESYHLVKFNRGPKIIKKKVTSGEENEIFYSKMKINVIAHVV